MKRTLSLLLSLVLLCSLLPGVRASEFQTDLSLSVGSDESMRNVTWYALSQAPGYVILCEKERMEDGTFPKDAAIFPSFAEKTNDGDYYSHKATVTGLAPETDYVYQLVNGDISSPLYSFTTPPVGDFSFAFAGDPQLGGGDKLAEDAAGWAETLNRIDSHESFRNTAFLLTAGDHVDDKDDEAHFDALLHHEVLSRLPMANVIGNHEAKSNTFAQHFFRPNESEQYGVTAAGGNAYFLYGNTLFFLLNSNDKDTSEHKAFMEAVLSRHPNTHWQIVALHHSLYTVSKHAEDDSILTRREELVPLFQSLGIDLVLMGHDHVYCRSYIMDGLTPLVDKNVYDKWDYRSVTNPHGVLYLVANSSSGSKTYRPNKEEYPYCASSHQFHNGEISRISVTDESLEIHTYLAETMELLDSFAIYRREESPHPFRDVEEHAWYHRAVQYGYDHDLIKGTGANSFSPELSTTRGMFVTMLYRLSGNQKEYPLTFADVSPHAYYAKAVAWAASCGIVYGVDEGHFAPDAPITREQLVTMLSRYHSGGAPDSAAVPENYSDGKSVSSYARGAMAWALDAGLIVGTGKNRLDPQGTATRAQVAQILMCLNKLPEDAFHST